METFVKKDQMAYLQASNEWADDFDILEFVHYANKNVRKLIDMDDLAERLLRANIVTKEEYEWKKIRWEREPKSTSIFMRPEVEEDHFSSYMPSNKKICRKSSPLRKETVMNHAPRYCTKNLSRFNRL